MFVSSFDDAFQQQSIITEERYALRTFFEPYNAHHGSWDSRRPQSLREVWLALSGLAAVFLFEMLDNSILNVTLPTIGHELHATTLGLQWIINIYMLVFGGLMLVFGGIADRIGRRRLMLIGLVLLATASLATPFVQSVAELIAVRAAMGFAATMTTPGSIALTFRLFDNEQLRMRTINLMSTVGLIGMAIAPTVGGFLLTIFPWQVLLLINVPIAGTAFAGITAGVTPDDPANHRREPVDILGGALGTLNIMLILYAPTCFITAGAQSAAAWFAVDAGIATGILFILRERTHAHPMLDLHLVANPLVSSGLSYKAASGLVMAGISYMLTLQLQFAWGGRQQWQQSVRCPKPWCSCSVVCSSILSLHGLGLMLPP